MALRALARSFLIPGVVLSAAACSPPGPRPLAFGVEECAHCHMTLSDPRFAGELVTSTGRIIPFDDIGCLAAYVADGAIAADRIASLWVHDFLAPHALLDVRGAVFVRDTALRTPMDYGIMALRPGPEADSLARRAGAGRLSWDDVLVLSRSAPHR